MDGQIAVRDADGDERVLPNDEVEVLERAGRAVICANDEDDEGAGWHGHIYTTWAEYDAEALT